MHIKLFKYATMFFNLYRIFYLFYQIFRQNFDKENMDIMKIYGDVKSNHGGGRINPPSPMTMFRFQ